VEAYRKSTKARVNLGIIAIALTILVNTFFYYLNRNFQMEDALIYYRYIENALSGDGLVYNKGEYVNSLSSPLYTYLSLAMAALVGDIHVSQILLNCLLATLWGGLLIYYLKDKVAAPLLLLVPFAVATHPYFFKVVGMETHLLILLCTIALVLYQKGKYLWLAVVSSLLLLTRGESVFLLVALAIEHVRARREFPKRALLVFPIVVVAANYTFAYLYYGSALPHSLFAKVSQGKSGYWGPWPAFVRVKHHVDWFFGGSTVQACAFLALAGFGYVAKRRTWMFRVVTMYLLFYTAFFLLLNIPNYHWYYSMYYYFGSVGVILGADAALGRAMRSPAPACRDKLGAMVFVILLSVLSVGYVRHDLMDLPKAGPNHAYRAIGTWIDQHLEADAAVAAVEIGTLGWYSKRYIIDILGLVTPMNSRFIAEKRFAEWLHHQNPDYVLIHDPPWVIEKGILDYARAGKLEQVRRFEFGGYTLLKPTAASVLPPPGRLVHGA
jgi:arabinofuranosyltransferase